MKAVYIVDDVKIAKILVDPMRRAILDLLRQKPMTQAGLANELGQEVWRTYGVIKVLNELQVTLPETAGPSKILQEAH